MRSSSSATTPHAPRRRAQADIEPHLVDDHGRIVEIGRKTPAVSSKLLRALLLRDQACRIGGLRHGLQAHHLRPRSWDGIDGAENLSFDLLHP